MPELIETMEKQVIDLTVDSPPTTPQAKRPRRKKAPKGRRPGLSEVVDLTMNDSTPSQERGNTNDVTEKSKRPVPPVKIRRPSMTISHAMLEVPSQADQSLVDSSPGHSPGTPRGPKSEVEKLKRATEKRRAKKARKSKLPQLKDMEKFPNNSNDAAARTDLFFIDDGNVKSPPLLALPDVLPATKKDEVPIAKTSDLLLPAHVFLSEGDVPSSDQTLLDVPASPVSSVGSHVQFIDDDVNSGPLRYFHSAQDAKTRTCSQCGQGGHTFKSCTMLICMTCGAKEEHPTRSCPISLTCWNCGKRGHRSQECPEPRNWRGCERCGSRTHGQNSCPTLWRIYLYMTNEEREEEILRRSSRAGQEIGSGGEGYIGWDQECFVCGSIGHWGYDCMSRFPDPAVRDPPAFSSFNANTGPFPEDTIDRHNGMRIAAAIRHSERASKKRREDTAALTTFADGYGFSGEANVGKRGREKAQREARQAAHKRQLEEEDEPDWFADHNTARRGHTGYSNGTSGREESRRNSDGGSKKRRKDQSLASAQEEVAGWFTDQFALPLRPPEGTREEREEQEFLRYQQNQGGQFRPDDQDFQRPDRETDRYRGRNHGPERRRNPEHEGARDRRRDKPNEGKASRAPPISIKGASGSAWGKGNSKSRNRSPDHVDSKERERATWNRDQREELGHDHNPSTNGHRPNGHRDQSNGRSSSGFVNGPRYRGGYGI